MFLLILVASGAAAASSVHANSAYDTPAGRFWEKALPGTPMPEAIADLIQEGIFVDTFAYTVVYFIRF
jgi:hypothetical protein